MVGLGNVVTLLAGRVRILTHYSLKGFNQNFEKLMIGFWSQ